MSELEEFFTELRDRADEIPGSRLALGDGKFVWLHTPEQVIEWLDEAMGLWRESNAPTRRKP